MNKIEKILEQMVLSNAEEEIKEFLGKETMHDVYEFFLERDKSITIDEFDECVAQMLELGLKNSEIEPLDSDKMDQIVGGANILSKFGGKVASVFLAALTLFPGMNSMASAAGTNAVAGGNSRSSAVEKCCKMKDTAGSILSMGCKKVYDFVKSHPWITTAMAVTMLAAVGTAIKVKSSSNNTNKPSQIKKGTENQNSSKQGSDVKEAEKTKESQQKETEKVTKEETDKKGSEEKKQQPSNVDKDSEHTRSETLPNTEDQNVKPSPNNNSAASSDGKAKDGNRDSAPAGSGSSDGISGTDGNLAPTPPPPPPPPPLPVPGNNYAATPSPRIESSETSQQKGAGEDNGQETAKTELRKHSEDHLAAIRAGMSLNHVDKGTARTLEPTIQDQIKARQPKDRMDAINKMEEEQKNPSKTQGLDVQSQIKARQPKDRMNAIKALEEKRKKLSEKKVQSNDPLINALSGAMDQRRQLMGEDEEEDTNNDDWDKDGDNNPTSVKPYVKPQPVVKTKRKLPPTSQKSDGESNLLTSKPVSKPTMDVNKKAEEAKKKAEEEAAKKKAEADALAKKRAEEEAAKKKAEADALAKRRAEEEAAKKKAEADALAKKRAEEEASKKKAEADALAKKRAEEEAAKKKAEADALAKKRAEEEAAKKKAEADALAKKRAEEEASKKKAEADASKFKLQFAMGGKALPALPTSTPTPTPTSTPTPTPTSTSSETPTVVTPHIETSEEKIKRLISEIGAIDKSISSLESNRKQVRGKLTHRMSKLEKEQDNKLKQEISAKEKEKNALENEIKNLKNEKKKSSKEQGGTGGFFPQGRM